MGIRSYIQQALESTVYYGSNVNRSITSSIAERVDEFFNYTSLLLDGDGTDGTQNNTFLDSSSNNFTITRNGNTTQGSFSPFGDKWSNYFDGTGDYLSIPGSSAFAITTSTTPFTIEAWIYLTGNNGCLFSEAYTGAGNSVAISISMSDGTSAGNTAGSTIAFGYYTGSAWVEGAIANTSVPFNTWTHVACVFTGSTTKIFYNGVDVTKSSSPTPATTWGVTGVNGDSWTIGRRWDAASTPFFNGYISNFRFVKGTALYTSDFTPPTEPLTAVSGTSLLTCQSNRFLDASTNNFTITRNGDVRVQSFNPFGLSSSYSPASDGASGYFDGNTDFLSTPTSSEFNFSGQNFTIETWIYPTSAAPANATSFIQSQQGEGNWYALIRIGLNTNNTINVSAGAAGDYSSSETVTLNAWNHIAMVKSGSNVRVYLNGVQTSINITVTNSLNTNLSWWIGKVDNTPGGGTYVYYFSGFISNIRILKGTALYTSNFTPPTEPVSAITNTSLLLNFANAGIYDKTKNNVLETVGNAQVSTTQKKYGTGALYFDGTGDYLLISQPASLILGSGAFTIEFWFNTGSSTRYAQLIGNETTNGFTILINNTSSTSGDIAVYNGASGLINSASGNYRNNTWYHLAFVRDSSGSRLFIDGVQQGSTNSGQSSTSFDGTTFRWAIGANLQFSGRDYVGYIDELRITKGIARYTTSFTPPTREFPAIFGPNTEVNPILASGGNNIIDDATNGYRTHVFTSPGSFVVHNNPASDIGYLVVAGGGGGGAGAQAAANGGGGGGGGFRTGTGLSFPLGTYPITVGGGGAADAQGNPSIFSTITSTGGGYGGGTSGSVGGSGGSGGGGRTAAGGPYAGGSGNAPPVSPPQGNPGGVSKMTSPFEGGGGGGAGEAGNTDGFGFGGDGSPITWLPASYGTPGTAPGRYFSGGGGGGSDAANIIGGEGGGGSGGQGAPPSPAGTPGTTNTGGGGGGGASQPPAIPGLSGGSGIVAVRYPKTFDNIVRDGLVLNLDAGDIASYPGSGTTWFDLAGNGNNGTLVNGVSYSGDNLGSLSFDGVNDNTLLPTNFFSFPSLTTFTISLWFKSSQTSGGTLFGQQIGSDPSTSTGWVPVIYLRTDGKIRIEPFWTGSGDNNILSSSALNDSNWHNIITTFNSGTNQLYVDGVYDTQQTGKTLTSFTNTYSYIVGAGYADGRSLGTNYFSGNISNFSFYNKALSASEIEQNFDALKGRFGL